MSLLLAGLVLAGTSGAVVVGRWLVRRRGAPGEAADEGDGADEGARAEVDRDAPTRSDEGADEARAPDPRRSRSSRSDDGEREERLEGFVCQLGDVILRITGEEAWLAGGVVLSEEIPVAVLFVAPDAGHDCAIYTRARPSRSLFWLEPLDPSAVLVGGEPPSAVEHGGIRFDRARRLPLRPRRIGVGAPDLADAVIVAEYASAGAERLLVLKASSGVVCAYRGLELEEGSFEVIASGRSTLE